MPHPQPQETLMRIGCFVLFVGCCGQYLFPCQSLPLPVGFNGRIQEFRSAVDRTVSHCKLRHNSTRARFVNQRDVLEWSSYP